MLKNKYFSTFIAGTSSLITGFLKSDLKNIEFSNIFDGLVEYEIDSDQENIKKLKYLNNSFLELASFSSSSFSEFEQKVINFFKNNGEKVWELLVKTADKNPLTYRVMFYDKNKSMGVDKRNLDLIEKFISDKKLVNRTRPNFEITASFRSEEIGFLGIRLTYHPDYKKILNSGELRPEVSEILWRLSNPRTQDIFLDPFAGFGSIAAERDNKIFCSDIDEQKIKFLKKRFGHNKNIFIKCEDAQKLESIKDNSIDKIITDPPWGNFDKSIDTSGLYKNFIMQFKRVLRSDGIVVLLSAADNEIKKYCNDFDLEILEEYGVLISGRQASIYKIQKRT